jgi:hypothetical protein
MFVCVCEIVCVCARVCMYVCARVCLCDCVCFLLIVQPHAQIDLGFTTFGLVLHISALWRDPVLKTLANGCQLADVLSFIPQILIMLMCPAW